MAEADRNRLAGLLLRAPVVDGCLAAVLLLWTLVELFGAGVPGPLAVSLPAGLAMAAPFAVRSRLPIAVGLVVMTAFFVQSRLGVEAHAEPSTIATAFLAGHAVAAHRRLRLALAAGLVVVALGAFSVPVVGNALFAALVVGGGWLVGRLLRARRLEAERLEALALERAVEAQTCVLEERARIARELHDVVAHSVSVMVVQAGAAGEVIQRNPAAARTSLERIEESGRQALHELRWLLGVLRDDGDDVSRVPTPGLAQVPELVEQMQRAGLPVHVVTTGTPPDLEPGIELTAFRLVQEALTNALKHGGHRPVSLDIRYADAEIQLSVVGVGPAPVPPPRADPARANGTGQGLIGMRERVRACGGRLEVCPRAVGGYAVRAWLPATRRGA